MSTIAAPALVAVDAVLRDAGLTAGIRRPSQYPPDGFVVYFLNGGSDPTRVTQDVRIELEGWGPDVLTAIGHLDRARGALHAATGTHGIRRVENVEGPADLPTGEEDWTRFTATVRITMRTPTT